MKSFEVQVSENQQQVAALEWQVREQVHRSENGARELLLELTNKDVRTTLHGAVDTSRGPGEHRLWLLVDDRDERVAMFGGPTAYWLDRVGRVLGSEHLYRDAKHEEYWDLKIVTTEGGAVVVYEGGAMFLDQHLRPQWHIQKRYNDIFERVDGERVCFMSETGECWYAPSD